MIQLARALGSSSLCAMAVACSSSNSTTIFNNELGDLSFVSNQNGQDIVEGPGKGAHNIILMIADGYGPVQADATRMYLNGDTAPLSFEKMPHRALLTTHNARREITDSAASATAMATGRKVWHHVVSVAAPGNGSALMTALEFQQRRGKSTALVTTQTSLLDATPAAFGAHALDRGSSQQVANDYFTNSLPELLIGGSASPLSVSFAQSVGYFVPRDTEELLSIVPGQYERTASWFHPSEAPSLTQLAELSLTLLSQSPAGFFLLLEHEGPDTGGHHSDLSEVLAAASEFELAVQYVLDWAAQRDDTLVIVGADHETGGLVLSEEAPKAGRIPSHSYTANGHHTGVPVPFFAMGPGAERLAKATDNTDIFPLLAGFNTLQLGGTSSPPATLLALREGALPNETEELALRVDLDGIDDDGRQQAILLKFEDAVSKLPSGAHIAKAYLQLEVSNDDPTAIGLHRVLAPWSQDSTWESFGTKGPLSLTSSGTAQNPEVHIPSQTPGIATFEVSEAIRLWQQAPHENQGWLLMADGTDGLGLEVMRGETPPRLTIHFD